MESNFMRLGKGKMRMTEFFTCFPLGRNMTAKISVTLRPSGT